MEREEGGQPLSGTVEMLAVEPSAAVENAGTAERGPCNTSGVTSILSHEVKAGEKS
jgi:hypothetical protein